MITSVPLVLGILIAVLAAIFYTSSSDNRIWKGFYKWVPMLLMCYFVPAVLTTTGLVAKAPGNELYGVAKSYFLPASLILLTLSISLKDVFRLGPKALIMFGTGTVGVILGGPIALLITAKLFPSAFGDVNLTDLWHGFATVAGSWIGGGANQVAMKETFEPPEDIYTIMVAVDVIVAEAWMLLLLLGVDNAKRIDKWFRADASAVEALKEKTAAFSMSIARVPSTADLMVILAIAFGGVALATWLGGALADWLAVVAPSLAKFSLHSKLFWVIVLSTTIGLLFSFTPLRKYEGAGASKLGTVFIFLLVATIGLHMDISALTKYPSFFLIGGIWMLFHVVLLLIVGYLIKAPYFFLAVGSKANIGGAASAPVVAGAFHPSLAPVGVLLAVLGYALGTYGALICAYAMEWSLIK